VQSRIALRPIAALALFLVTASLAPRPAPPPLVNQRKSLNRVTRHFAAGLEYLVVEPREVGPDAELPMVVWLHGRGGEPTPPPHRFLGLEQPVRLILPRAPLRSGDGYEWMPVSAHHGESEALNAPLRQRMRELSEAMTQWRRRHPTRGRPIVAGFSQGGILTATLAVTHPEALYRAFPLAGWIPDSLAPDVYDPYAVHVPMHALHGADDPIIGAARTRDQLARMRQMGYPVVYEELANTEHEITPEMLDRLRALIARALLEQSDEAFEAGNS